VNLKTFTQKRNRAKGQFAYMRGTADSMQELHASLTMTERNVLTLISVYLSEVLEHWEANTEQAKGKIKDDTSK